MTIPGVDTLPPTITLDTFPLFVAFKMVVRPHIITPLSAHTGRYFNGLIYRLLERKNTKLADEWHNHRNPKPFTVSMLEGQTVKIRERPCAVPGQTYALRITLLERAGYRLLNEALGEHVQYEHPLYMKQYPFSVEQVVAPPFARTADIGMTTPADLAKDGTDSDTITLEFTSPTAFKGGTLTLLFPQPLNVFGSLQRNWEAFAPQFPLHPDLRTYMQTGIAVSQFQLETTYTDAGEYQLKGFVGRCTYKLLGQDKTLRLHINRLANFAMYAGVGMKTTQGMGQTRRIK
jgi:CRISPR-associated endoribonuclease Cas6